MTDIASLGFRADSRELRTASRELDGVSRSARNTESATERLNSQFDRQNRMLGMLKTAYRAAALAIGALVGGSLIGSLVAVNDQYANIAGRLKLVTSGSEQLAQVQDDLFNAAQRSGQAYGVMAELYTRVAQNAKELGLTQRELLGFTETTSQAFLVSGASAAESAGAIRQLTQALASGVFRGEEFNSVAEQGPRILQALTESLGVSRGELRAMAEDGKLTAGIVIRALQGQASAIQKEFDALPVTVGRAMQNLRDVVSRSIGNADAGPLVESIQELQKTLSSPEIANGLQELASGLLAATGQATKLLSIIGDNRTEIATTAMVALAVAAGRVGAGYAAQAQATIAAMTLTRAHSVALAENAARHAQSATAQVAETAAKINDTKATLAAVTAARAEYAESLQSANAKLAAARAALQNTAATLAEGNVVQRTLQATLAASHATRARSAALAQLAILGQQQVRLEAQMAAATTANAAAQARSAAASTAASGALAATGVAARAAAAGLGALRFVFVALGGWVGIAITAIIGFIYWLNKAKDEAADGAGTASKSLRELAAETQSVRNGGPLFTDEQLGALKTAQERINNMARAIGILDEQRKQAIGRGDTGGAAAMQSEIDKISAAIKREADDMRALTEAVKPATEASFALAGATGEVSKEAQKQHEKIQQMIQSLEEELVLSGDLSKADEVRISLANGYYGTVSAGQAQQLQGIADLITAREEDKKRTEEQTEAVKKLNDEAARIYEATRTPLEKYRAELEKLDMLRARFDSGLPGGITDDTYRREVGRLNEELAQTRKGLDNVKAKGEDAFGSLSVYADQAARNMQDALAEFLFDPFAEGLDGMIAGFARALQHMAADAAAAEIFGGFSGKGGLGGLLGPIGAALGGWLGGGATPGAVDFANQDPFGPVQYLAEGGYAQRGKPHIVGEEGMEVFWPRSSGTVVPNEQLGGGRVTVNNNITIVAPKGTVSEPTMNQIANRAGRSTTQAMRKYS